jgi:hypothetical protein
MRASAAANAGSTILMSVALAACQRPAETTDAPANPVLDHPVTDDADADVVLVFPAASDAELDEQWQALRPWMEARAATGLSFDAVLLSEAVGDETDPGTVAVALRGWLATNLTERPGRYLGLLGRPLAESDPDAALPAIPMFALDVADEIVRTDLAYGDPSPALEWEGRSRFGGFEIADPTFLTFRVPVTSVEDMARFASRAVAYDGAPHRGDALLVGGTVAITGDTAIIQCGVERALDAAGVGGRVAKVFDADECDPDLVVADGGDRLAQYMAGTWEGGFVYDISHGSSDAVYYQGADGLEENLGLADAGALPDDTLGVFVSLSCDNDSVPESGWNLNRAMFERWAVATITSTVPTTFGMDVQDAITIEQQALPTLMSGDGTLLDAVGDVRTAYAALAADYSRSGRNEAWANLLGMNVTGDGLMRVRR